MRKYLILLMWLSCLSVATRGQTLDDADLSELLQPKQAQAFDYWFDDDTGHLQTVNSLSGTYAFDVSSLPNGLHMLHCQVKGASGEIYGTDSRLFLTMNDTESLPDATLAGAKLRYWFDEDAGSLKDASGVSGTYAVDVSALSDGLHTLHYMLVGTDGSAYSTRADMFIKMEEMLSDPTAVTTVAAQRVTYWFDDDAGNKQTANSLSGIYTLDVTALDDGLHLLHYYVEGEDGLPYGLTSRMFLKDEGQFAVHEPNRITKYTYWVNNSVMETVTLDQPVNPYSLISLLPLQTMPIRSSNFHFQVDDGVPTIYAKNTFNIRFYDSEDHFVDNFMDNERTFIDYGVKQLVEIVGELQATQMFDRLGENEVRWYTVNLERGDSVDFKTDKACSIQLFSPSGTKSVKLGGCHALETGTYYLALHDITAQQGSTITLDYQHIDKYAVLCQDVYIVGNSGCSTITFEGNGFRDLFAVDLHNEQGEVITHIDIGHENDATTSVAFDFSGATLGQYTALFHFADEDKVFNNYVVVEEARDIELETKVDYSRIFHGGMSTTYTMEITNKGNMTAYYMPFYVMIKSNSNVDISKVEITGLDLQSIFYDFDKDNLSEEERKELLSFEEQIGSDYFFVGGKVYDETIRDSVFVWTALFFANIPPCTEKTIYFKLYTGTDVELRVLSPKSMSPLIANVKSKEVNLAKVRNVQETYCCWRNQIECILSIVSDVASLANFITAFDPSCSSNTIASLADCLIGSLKQVVQYVDNSVCGSSDYGLPATFEDAKAISNRYSFIGTLITCLSKALPWNKVKSILNGIGAGSGVLFGGMNSFATFTECILALDQMFNSSCPSAIDIGGGKSTPVFSADPNEIYGYTAESGSKAVMDGQTDVYYTIEFENDPEFATASAHDIYLTDVLDATKFDLSTYKPTRVKIGNKSADLSGEKNFVTTIDMRPEIYAIAQVEGSYDEQTGVANWHISSLDPMTMEPTENLLDGILPVNTDGLGIGEVSFDISLKPGLSHGTEINNQASIIFDNNDPIVTPVWTNVMDCVKPESLVSDVVLADNGMAEVSVSATDELSGPWRYDVYVQYGQGSAWFKAAENVDIDKAATVSVYQGIDHGFCTIVTDAAGNVEQKTMAREFSLSVPYILGDVNGDGKVTVTDVLLIMDKAQGKSPEYFVEEAADLNGDGAVTLADAIKALAMILDHD